jgi:ubiquinone/menaquinone biosynthesis C-methylase UbiE
MVLVEELKNKTVLDLGCGDGSLLRKLRDKGAGVVLGLDVSHDRLRYGARAQGTLRTNDETGWINYVQADGNLLPFRDESIDHIVSSVVLYLLDQRKALDEVKRVLKPSGLFTFTDTTGWYCLQRIASTNDQPENSSRFRSIIGLSYILVNGAIYNYFGVAPLLRSFTSDMWYIYQSEKRMQKNISQSGLIVRSKKVLTRWRSHPVLFQMTLQKPQITNGVEN